MLRHIIILISIGLSALMISCRSAQSPVTGNPSPLAQKAKVLPYEEQRRFDGLYLEALRQKEKESFDAAYELLGRALQINPDAPEALYEMGLLKMSFSSFSDSLLAKDGDSLMQRTIALEPSNKYYKEILARFCAGRGEYDRAIKLYEELAGNKPTAELLTTLVSLYEETNDYNGAIRSINRLETLEGKSEALSIEKFKIYIRQNDDARAYAAVESLCAEYPSDLRYRVLLGDLYLQNGHKDQAMGVYKDVLTAEPGNVYAQMSMMNYYKAENNDSLYSLWLDSTALNPNMSTQAKAELLKQYAVDTYKSGGDSSKVLKLFKRVLDMPQEDRTIAELCAYYMGLIKYPTDSLAPVMRKILAVEPDYTMARLQLLQINFNHDDMASAIKLCQEGQLYDPSQIAFYFYEGICQYRKNNVPQALMALEKGMKHIDENSDNEYASDLFATAGDIYHDKKEYAKAYAAYDSAIVYNPENYLCLNNYAYFLSLNGKDLDKAEQMSYQVVKANPTNPTYLDTYAWVLFVKRQYHKAKAYIDETLRNATETPDNASLYEHAGDIYSKCGETSKAVDFWKKALKLTDDRKEKAVIKKKIKLRKYIAK